mmetsp:Transcript_2114/g.4608  ORF Transcript_2114/g.4608 Transcript_2114/m.4608 type:complete len:196 (+) Transcript_2114:177-764(+)|eukprot:scaffold8405_cov169-Amphora_coffeaeformis.AAC.3
MVTKTLLLQDDKVSQFNRPTFLKASSWMQPRSERPTTMKTKTTRVPRASLRRTKSLPAQLDVNEYTGRHLFWFTRNVASRRKVPDQNSLSSKPEQEQEGVSQAAKPPRPLMSRLFGVAPVSGRKMMRRSIGQPFLVPDTRNDSFETTSTITMDEYIDDNDETFANYSDDDDEDELMECEDEGVLRGLSFLEEERE